MKKILYTFTIILLLLTGCSNHTDFTLKGKIDGLPSDTLLIYYQVPDTKIDTLICKDGAFEYTFAPDTSMVFSLLLDDQEKLPIFVQKGETVEITGDIKNLTIQGEGENQLLNEMMDILRSCPKETLNKTIDSLINANNSSLTCLYLIEKYDGENDSPNITHLKKRIESLSGVVKDTPYMINLQGKINQLSTQNSSIYSLPGQDREGNTIKWTSLKDQYILIDFWASWHSESIKAQDSLENVLKALNKENFIVYSVSLDLNKEEWLQASDRDIPNWHQVCDFKGWNNSIIKSQGINDLPSNLLLDKNKRIIARNIRGQELIDKIKELARKDKERSSSKRRK